MPPDPVPPVPIAGTFTIFTQTLVLTFDQPLVVGMLDERDWRVEANAVEWDPNTAAVLGGAPADVVSTYMAGGGAPGSLVQYTAAAADLFGQNGLPVAPFVFPVVVVP